MIDHLPWIGPEYWSQPSSERLLIAGFSPLKGDDDPAPDNDEFTRNVFDKHVFGGNIRFFNSIASFFGEDGDTFWCRVAFANTLPNVVGGPDDRYSAGSKEQREAIAERVKRLILETKPARIFVFTRKGWRLWPVYTGALTNGTLHAEGAGEYDAGTYSHSEGEAIAFGFPHPQYTPIVPTVVAIAAVRRARVADLAPRGEG